MATHFLADLHLNDAQEPFARLLHQYLNGPARQAEAVYVLGDLFEVWIGDDGSLPRHRATIDSFAALADTGVPLYFMRGNRDFAVGDTFARSSGMKILDDLHVIDLYGVPTLLSHGDVFCTDDHEHQVFREQYMDPEWRARKLRLPLWSRKLVAKWARHKSRRGKARKPRDIMDVNERTVKRVMAEYGARQLIHGHTHRPDTYQYDTEDSELRRIVLPDWRYGQTGVLTVDKTIWETLWLPANTEGTTQAS